LKLGKKSGQSIWALRVVRVGGVNFDFFDAERFEAHPYACHVSDEEFDAIFGRGRRAE
jgi:hypothetical protein